MGAQEVVEHGRGGQAVGGNLIEVGEPVL